MIAAAPLVSAALSMLAPSQSTPTAGSATQAAAAAGSDFSQVMSKVSSDAVQSLKTAEAVSTDYALHRGVYQSGERLIAVNRPAAEDGAAILKDDRIAGLFKGLDFSRVDDQAGNVGSLIQEIWRLFLATMMVAMLVEAGLCLPRKPTHAAVSAQGFEHPPRTSTEGVAHP